MKITLIVSCLEWLTCLLLFIMVGFEKLQPRKSFKSVQCSDEFMFNSHMRCYVTQWSMTMWWPQQFVQTPSPRQKKFANQINLEVM